MQLRIVPIAQRMIYCCHSRRSEGYSMRKCICLSRCLLGLSNDVERQHWLRNVGVIGTTKQMAANTPLCPPVKCCFTDEVTYACAYCRLVEWKWQGKTDVPGTNSRPEQSCPPQNSHGMPRTGTRVADMLHNWKIQIMFLPLLCDFSKSVVHRSPAPAVFHSGKSNKYMKMSRENWRNDTEREETEVTSLYWQEETEVT
jgi:hypothetical protein